MFNPSSTEHRSTSSLGAFTLIETLIVLGLGVLLLGLSLVYFGGFHTGGRVDTAAKELASVLESAQVRSIGQEDNSRWGVYIDNPSSGIATFTLYRVDEDLFTADPPTVGVPGATIERQPVASGITMTDPASGTYLNVVFSRGTGLPDTIASVSLVADNYPDSIRTVTVSDNGRIEYR